MTAPATRPAGVTALVAVAGLAEAASLAGRAAASLAGLEAVELVEAEALELVADKAGTHPPLAGRAMVLLECVAGDTALEAFLGDSPEVRGLLVCFDAPGRDELWSWCEAIAELVVSASEDALKVELDLDTLAAVLAGARAELGLLPSAACLVAHASLGEGRLHLAIVGGAPSGGAGPALRGALERAGGHAATGAAPGRPGGKRW
jgi:hypothetical protein